VPPGHRYFSVRNRSRAIGGSKFRNRGSRRLGACRRERTGLVRDYPHWQALSLQGYFPRSPHVPFEYLTQLLEQAESSQQQTVGSATALAGEAVAFPTLETAEAFVTLTITVPSAIPVTDETRMTTDAVNTSNQRRRALF
jgi:hypothetical protein